MRRLAALICLLSLCAGCSEPPQKEIDRAQGAIDAARAAGAPQYAAAQFADATAALQQSHDAVDQRDYRLALSRALDASQRAQESARAAAEGQARARSEAEIAVHTSANALQQLQTRIKAAAAARMPDADVKAAQRAVSDTERTLQNARSALAAGKFLEAQTAVKDTVAAINEQISALDEAPHNRAAKRRR